MRLRRRLLLLLVRTDLSERVGVDDVGDGASAAVLAVRSGGRSPAWWLHTELLAEEGHEDPRLLLAVAGHLRLQVARDREVDESVPARIGVEQRDGVGVLVGAPAGALLARRVVGAEQEDGRPVGEE